MASPQQTILGTWATRSNLGLIPFYAHLHPSPCSRQQNGFILDLSVYQFSTQNRSSSSEQTLQNEFTLAPLLGRSLLLVFTVIIFGIKIRIFFLEINKRKELFFL